MSVSKTKILFVCLGNICRSPAAEGIMRSLVEEKGVAELFEIDSAGTYGGHAGELPDSRMRVAAHKRGHNLTHRSRPFSRVDFERFDKIIVMDDSNYTNVCRLSPDSESLQKVQHMADYCLMFDVSNVPDPYYEGEEGFEYVLDILEDACECLLEELMEND